MSKLEPDIGHLGRYVRAIFKHATVGTFVSLRAFPREGKATLFIRGFKIEEGGLDNIIMAAAISAREAANHVLKNVVFSPPTATFDNNYFARLVDLVEGPVLSTECDAHPLQALKN
jgi:hypothetical protein